MRSKQCPEERETEIYAGFEKKWKALSKKLECSLGDSGLS